MLKVYHQIQEKKLGAEGTREEERKGWRDGQKGREGRKVKKARKVMENASLGT